MNEVKAIREKHKDDFGNDMTGFYDSAVYDFFNKVGMGNKSKMTDYNKISNILQKQINQLLKERSGAAVTDAEFQRLMKEMPNLKMSGQQFDVALEQFNNSLRSALNSKARSFGFDDANKLINRASGKKSQSQGYEAYFQ
jgi:hypothetical protein